MKKKTFVPYFDKVQIKPIEDDSVLKGEGDSFLSVGIVIAVGSDVNFLKKGDTVFFVAYGVDKTPEIDGEQFYVVSQKSEFILGKYGSK